MRPEKEGRGACILVLSYIELCGILLKRTKLFDGTASPPLSPLFLGCSPITLLSFGFTPLLIISDPLASSAQTSPQSCLQHLPCCFLHHKYPRFPSPSQSNLFEKVLVAS